MPKTVLLYTDSHSLCGVGRKNAELLTDFREAGYRTVCAQRPEALPLQDRLTRLGVEYRFFSTDPEADPSAFANDRDTPRHLFSDVRPDVILFSNGHPLATFGAMDAAIDLGIPYIIREGLIAPHLLPGDDRQIAAVRAHYLRAAATVCMSGENLGALRAHFDLPGDVGEVIYDGPPPRFFEPRDAARRAGLRRQFGVPEEAILCFTAAKLEPVKGYRLQLTAIDALRRHPAWERLHFAWAGEGTLRGEIEASVAHMGVGGRVRLLGQREDIPECLDAADIFVLPSFFEGLSGSLVEAMAKGVAVIATGVGGHAEALDGYEGLLDAPRDAEEAARRLHDAIAAFAGDGDLRRRAGRTCRERAAKFSQARMHEEYRRLVAAAAEATGEAAFEAAVRCQEQGDTKQAAALYRTIIDTRPDMVEASVNLANLLIAEDDNRQARALLESALRRAPHFVEAINSLSVALKNLGEVDAAVARLEAGLGIDPGNARLLNNLGNIRREGGDLDRARDHYRKAVASDPGLATAHFSLGLLAKQEGAFAAAVDHFEAAIRARPHFAEAHFSLGMTLLTLGRFAEGWPNYEWRWKCAHFPGRDIDGTPWSGEDVAGKTVLLHAEQGYGDTLQFIRYAAHLKQRGATVAAFCQPHLKRVIAGVPGIDSVIGEGEPVPPFDVYVAALSVPAILGIDPSTDAGAVPYIWAPADHDRGLDGLLAAAAETVRVGIAWAGRRTHENDRLRSSAPGDLRPLADLTGVTLFSLQKDEPAPGEDLPGIVDAAPALRDFADTAALVDGLDLVIAVDTAVAHLAGAMGRPVWLALPAVPDWRWMVGHDDSPWYPTARLFRQETPGDWAGVFARMAQALGEWPVPDRG